MRAITESQEEPIEKSSNVEQVNTITPESIAEEAPRRKKKSSQNISDSLEKSEFEQVNKG